MAEQLYKRGSTWWGWFYDASGRRVVRSTKCKDKRAAEAVVREWERAAADPDHPAANAATLADALKHFLKDRANSGGAMIGRMRTVIERALVTAGVALAFGACAHQSAAMSGELKVVSTCRGAEPASEERTSPSAEEVHWRVNPFKDDVAACFEPGVVDISFAVEGYTGGVSKVKIKEGTATAGCVERVFADVCFGPFREPIFETRFPFKLRGTGRATTSAEWKEVAPGAAGSCPTARPSSEGRPTPGREDVVGAMLSIKDDVAACFKESGAAQIQYDVQGATGRITRLHIDGPAAAPGCVERAFARLCFEPFRKETFKVTFPFMVGPR